VIVFVTPILPACSGNGLAMRAGLFLEGMARTDAVTVVVVPVVGQLAPEDQFVTALASACVTLELADAAEERTWPSVLLSTPAGRRRAADLYPLPALCRRPSAAGSVQLRRLTGRASLVHVMRIYLAPCVDFLLDEADRPPVALDLDELDSGVQRQLGCAPEAEGYERLEREYVRGVDRLYVASPDDARILEQTYGVDHVSTVVNAVRAPAPIEPTEPRYDLLFVGNLSYAPNIAAAKWLCATLRPLLDPVTIAIVGSHPGPEVRALGSLPGVTVAGDVPDVGPWYACSRVAVAPLSTGGGTRTKIVEALAYRRPVVATLAAAAGREVGEEHGILVADKPHEFAAACRRLLDDARVAAAVATAGSRNVRMAGQVIGEIESLTRATRGPPPCAGPLRPHTK
jgi:glycosyltransferase involved in cell wall biosynthesis